MTAKELVEKIVQLLSDSPNEVVVNELAGEQVSVLEIRVAQSDTGKVIGRKGRNIQAIRTILEALGGKQGKRYSVEIIG
ncbi:MAG: KH domain-containing protein [Proteobacteria bacterium]|nr:KH domain-containing protein [Pseudomonadota bacterium]